MLHSEYIACQKLEEQTYHQAVISNLNYCLVIYLLLFLKERRIAFMDQKEERKAESVSYFVHEGVIARMAECNRRLLIALIGTMVALVASCTIRSRHDDFCFS